MENTFYDSPGVSSNGTVPQHQPVALYNDAFFSSTDCPPAPIQDSVLKKKQFMSLKNDPG